MFVELKFRVRLDEIARRLPKRDFMTVSALIRYKLNEYNMLRRIRTWVHMYISERSIRNLATVGKGLNLGELTNINIQVPAGFALLRKLYKIY